jgi:hypothetical protein
MTGYAASTFSGSYGVIGGGTSNRIDASGGSALHNFIGGGANNVVTGSCSAIVGGCNNTVTHNWAGVFGCNIVSVMDCAMHSNNFVAQNMPDSSAYATLPIGALYYCVLGVGNCSVYIK